VDSAHVRYEELAVGHVLGGLVAADAADFRAHLLGCRECRLRVAELREIAADLVVAEREERADARVRTEVAQAGTEDGAHVEADPRGPALSSRHVGIGAVVLVLVLGTLAFWNLHLRTQVATVGAVAERQEDTLTVVADGVPVATEFADTTRGVVAVDGDRVGFTLSALPPLADGERLVVWLLDTEDGDVAVLLAGEGEGQLSGTVEDRDASTLVVTAQPVREDDAAPSGRELVRADLATPADR
jgi:hypothetical protein